MPYERTSRDHRHAWLIGDLEARHAVEARCLKCGHASMIAPHVLYARHRPTVGIAAIPLRCSACGSVDEVRVTVLVARPPLGTRDY
jgi:hypothetical protein